MYAISVVWLLIFSLLRGNAQTYTFPDDFIFGVGTAAYQIEGGWDEDGKGESNWDRLAHTTTLFHNGTSGDVACDSYHLYERDIEMTTELELDFYRFSISWTRVLPTGFPNKINQAGIDYYNKLIDGLIAKNVTPVVTIYHWDLPQRIEDLGGWTNEIIVDYYTDYANILFSEFGDRVKTWITMNEPREICNMYKPNDYLCGHNVIKAHAKAYHLYNDVYRGQHQDSQIGIVLNADWNEPRSESEEDIEASETYMQFSLGWFSHPIFSKAGDYPPVMREKVDKRSEELRYPFSRLPKFTAEEVEYIKGTSDFLGMNHYTSRMIRPANIDEEFDVPSRDDDARVVTYLLESWKGSAASWLYVVPWGMRQLMKWTSNEYNNVPIFITENGLPTSGGLEDDDRIE